MEMTEPLRIRDLHVAYGKADVISGVSLDITPGQITCLLGANGAGKTSLIRAIVGLTHASAGSIVYDGVDITKMAPHKIVRLGISCIPEGRRVFAKMTVEENLRMGAYTEPSRALIAERLEHVYQIFPRLKERRTQNAGTMSGGEQAMVSIGRGLMNEPALLIIDEPSLGLSPALVSENFRVIRMICESGISVFLVEQNVRQTLAISHRGYVLSQGKIVASGTAKELREDAQVQKAYFG